MEHKEIKASVLFGKILKTIVPLILWLLFVTYMGLYNGWLFFGETFSTGNIIFYGFSLLSLVGIIYAIVKLWNRK